MTKMKVEIYVSVWDAIANTPAEAANLRACSDLMIQIAEVIKSKRWTQSQAASNCNITQPRMNDLLANGLPLY